MDKGECFAVPDHVAIEETVRYEMNKTVLGSEPCCNIGRTDNTHIFVPRGLFSGLKRPDREFYHSVLSGAQVKKESRYMPTGTYVYFQVLDRASFAFYSLHKFTDYTNFLQK